ncbi:hypothetical protein H0H92_006812 [Tricholoma furcatifolium]|nr:hypothetical protein H0H92_006812 [Tricholoma furcatifolium]
MYSTWNVDFRFAEVTSQTNSIKVSPVEPSSSETRNLERLAINSLPHSVNATPRNPRASPSTPRTRARSKASAASQIPWLKSPSTIRASNLQKLQHRGASAVPPLPVTPTALPSHPLTLRMNSFRPPGALEKMNQRSLHIKLNGDLNKHYIELDPSEFFTHFPPMVCDLSIDDFIADNGTHYLRPDGSIPKMGQIAGEARAVEYLNHITCLFYEFCQKKLKDVEPLKEVKPLYYWSGVKADSLLRVGPWDTKPDLLLAPVTDGKAHPIEQLSWPWVAGVGEMTTTRKDTPSLRNSAAAHAFLMLYTQGDRHCAATITMNGASFHIHIFDRSGRMTIGPMTYGSHQREFVTFILTLAFTHYGLETKTMTRISAAVSDVAFPLLPVNGTFQRSPQIAYFKKGSKKDPDNISIDPNGDFIINATASNAPDNSYIPAETLSPTQQRATTADLPTHAEQQVTTDPPTHPKQQVTPVGAGVTDLFSPSTERAVPAGLFSPPEHQVTTANTNPITSNPDSIDTGIVCYPNIMLVHSAVVDMRLVKFQPTRPPVPVPAPATPTKGTKRKVLHDDEPAMPSTEAEALSHVQVFADVGEKPQWLSKADLGQFHHLLNVEILPYLQPQFQCLRPYLYAMWTALYPPATISLGAYPLIVFDAPGFSQYHQYQ